MSTLNTTAVDVLLDQPAAILYVLWTRKSSRGPWVKLLTSSSRRACVEAVKGSGEFWLAEVRTEPLAATLRAADQGSSDG